MGPALHSCMPNILSIETSADACSVSLLTGNRLVCLEADEPRNHARMLVPLIEQLLAAEGVELDGVCVDAGPGSYTGLRIGVSTAKGLSWSLGIPLYAISSLALMAAGAVMDGDADKGDGGAREAASGRGYRPVIPARGSEVYTALYTWNGTQLTTLEQPGVHTVDDLASPSSGDLLIASTPAMAERLGLQNMSADVIAPHSKQASLFLRNPGDVYRVEDVSSFEPLYLREFEAKQPAVSIFDRLPF